MESEEELSVVVPETEQYTATRADRTPLSVSDEHGITTTVLQKMLTLCSVM